MHVYRSLLVPPQPLLYSTLTLTPDLTAASLSAIYRTTGPGYVAILSHKPESGLNSLGSWDWTRSIICFRLFALNLESSLHFHTPVVGQHSDILCIHIAPADICTCRYRRERRTYTSVSKEPLSGSGPSIFNSHRFLSSTSSACERRKSSNRT